MPAGGAASVAPRIAASGTGVYCAWEDWRSGNADVYFKKAFGTRL